MTEFTKLFRAFMGVMERYKEFQRGEGAISPRRRMLLKVIEEWTRKRNETWVPFADVLVAYSTKSLQERRKGASTIREDLDQMGKGKDKLVLRRRSPSNQRIIEVSISQRGKDILQKEKEMEEERIAVYENILSPDTKKALEDFFQQSIKVFNDRMNAS